MVIGKNKESDRLFMQHLSVFFQTRQVWFYFIAIIIGIGASAVFSGTTAAFSTAINPVLALLLFATFLAVPMRKFLESFRNFRFLAIVTAVNFALVPLVALVLTRPVSGQEALTIGVLLVLLAPCVDYVIVFTRLAGGADENLLAATPVLMLLQVLLLPIYLAWFTGGTFLASMDARPFIEAFVFLILLPLVAAAIIQFLASHWRWPALVIDTMDLLMVPLMMLVLFLVISSQFFMVAGNFGQLMYVVPIYVAFLLIMGPLGGIIAKRIGLDFRSQRAVAFSGATRNSLVILPLALALAAEYPLVPAVVICQTVVELLGMLAYTRAIPCLLPDV